MPNIKVLIADDHMIVRKGLKALLTNETDFELVGEASDGSEAVEIFKKEKPDVVLMDLVMERMGGIEAISIIKGIDSEAKILVLTSFAEDEKVFPAIKAGALGYLLKDSSPEQLIDSIKNVYRGEPSLHPRIAIKVMKELNNPSDLPPTDHPLTSREVEVLRLVAQGMNNQEIAEELCISEWTARTHIRNILSKLHLANRIQAALYALREGIADLDNSLD